VDYATALWNESLADYSAAVVGGLIITIVLVRTLAPAEKSRIRAMVLLTVLHLLCLPIVAGFVSAAQATGMKDARLACLVFEVTAVIGMVSTMIFGVFLPRIGLHVPRILRDVIGAAVGIIALIAVAHHAGFPLTGLITTSAVLSAVIGFSLQDTLGNIMGGLALQMDNSIQVGDWVKVGDLGGRVVEIRWRFTSIETRNWETIVLPNSMLMRGQVLVLGRRTDQPLYWRRWVYFNVDFRYQPTDVIAAVNEVLQSTQMQNVSPDPVPHCICMDISDSFCRYAVRYWLTDLAKDDPTDSEVRIKIFFALKRANIRLSIPAHAVFMTERNEAHEKQGQKEEQDQRMAVLNAVELFSGLEEPDKVALAGHLRYAPFARGETMTRQGAEAHWLYMMIDGDASVRVSVEGIEKEVARISAGHFFGEYGLMTGEKRQATVVAITDVECYRLDKPGFQSIVHANPALADHIAGILAKRRVELLAVKEDLDEEAKSARMKSTKENLLGKIRDFFGLEHDGKKVA
jgi:small-conductance mechanosensitive channel/CRP-like cAMP-binding protein